MRYQWEIPQNDHQHFSIMFDPPKMGTFMIPVQKWNMLRWTPTQLLIIWRDLDGVGGSIAWSPDPPPKTW